MTIELLNVDCMEYMRDQPDGAFDLAIVDPPYGLERFKKGGSYLNRISPPGKWNNNKPDQSYFSELFRVSKVQIIWGGNNFTLPESEYFLIWDKGLTGKHDFAECEMAIVTGNIKAPAKIFKYGAQWCKEIRIHPTQKPVQLYKWLLSNYAQEGQRILDTHLGSGSSAIAAHYGGFDFVGCEIDQHFYDLAVNRFTVDTSQEAFNF